MQFIFMCNTAVPMVVSKDIFLYKYITFIEQFEILSPRSIFCWIDTLAYR